MGSEYDAENIFAKILDNKAPCFKVFESRSSLAFLDASPMVEGHTILVPKLKGHKDFLTMPTMRLGEVFADVQKVAKAVKAATGATAVNIWQNCGEDAGQTVFHPHFHIVPRHKDDGLHKPPASAKEMLSSDAAAPTVSKIVDALKPVPAPVKLRTAKFGKVGKIRPEASGLNLLVKVVGTPTVVESKVGKFWEVKVGDASGTVVLSMRENQKDVAKDGAILEVRNAAAKMISNHIRLTVDKWGKIAASDESIEGEVEMAADKDVSALEYELVK